MITGVVSERDYVDAYALHYRAINVVMNWVLVAILAVGAILVIVGVKPWGFVLVGGGVCGFIGGAIQRYLYLPATARKHYAQFKGIDSPIIYSWSAETFSVQSARGAGGRSWGDLRKVRENEQLFLLYTTDALFEVVPKAWFRDAGQQAEFRKFAWGNRET